MVFENHRVGEKFGFDPWAATSCGQNLERPGVKGVKIPTLFSPRTRKEGWGTPKTHSRTLISCGAADWLLAHVGSIGEGDFSVKVGRTWGGCGKVGGVGLGIRFSVDE